MANKNTRRISKILAQERKNGNTSVVLKIPVRNYHSTGKNSEGSLTPKTFSISICRNGEVSRNEKRNTMQITAGGSLTRHVPLDKNKPSFFQPVRKAKND